MASSNPPQLLCINFFREAEAVRGENGLLFESLLSSFNSLQQRSDSHNSIRLPFLSQVRVRSVTLPIRIDSRLDNQFPVFHKIMELTLLLLPMAVFCEVSQFFLASTREDSLVFFPELVNSLAVHGVESAWPVWHSFWKLVLAQVGPKLILCKAVDNAVPYEPV